MQPNKDFKELVGLFNETKLSSLSSVRMRWHSTALHGLLVISIFMCIRLPKCRKVLRALDEFGFGEIGLKLSDFSKEDKVTQLVFTPCELTS